METDCLSKITLKNFVIVLENRECELKLACQTVYPFWGKDNDEDLEPMKIYFLKYLEELKKQKQTQECMFVLYYYPTRQK